MGAAWVICILKRHCLLLLIPWLYSLRGWGLLNVINNYSDSNNVYILYSVRSEMGYMSITLDHKGLNIYLSEKHSLHSKMTYIAFFGWFSDVRFISLTLSHPFFFFLWLNCLISIHFSVSLCRFSTWGWIWWASVSRWGISPNNCFRRAHFHQSLHLHKSASGTSPSIWVLQKLLLSLNCIWLGTLGDLIRFFCGWC